MMEHLAEVRKRKKLFEISNSNLRNANEPINLSKMSDSEREKHLGREYLALLTKKMAEMGGDG